MTVSFKDRGLSAGPGFPPVGLANSSLLAIPGGVRTCRAHRSHLNVPTLLHTHPLRNLSVYFRSSRMPFYSVWFWLKAPLKAPPEPAHCSWGIPGWQRPAQGRARGAPCFHQVSVSTDRGALWRTHEGASRLYSLEKIASCSDKSRNLDWLVGRDWKGEIVSNRLIFEVFEVHALQSLA